MKLGRNHWPALWLLLILTLVAAARIPVLSLPLERDEGEYACAGQLMLEGVPPYGLVYNMKMPGTYAAYALIMAVFGRSAAGIRVGFMFANMATILLLYFVGRRFLDRAPAVAASAAYALLSASPHVMGLNAHATHFVVLAALGAILVLLRSLERGSLAGFFWSGALFGVAFLMKQPGGAFAFFGAALIFWTAWRRQPPDWKSDGLRLAAYAAGVAAPVVLTGVALWRAGVWVRFWWWTVTYARVHATVAGWQYGVIALIDFFAHLKWDGLFWALALAGLLGVLVRKGRADARFFFLLLFLASAASVCPTFHFTQHYFVLMLPVVALLAASLFASVAARLSAHPLAMIRAAPWMLFAAAWAGVAWHDQIPVGAFFSLKQAIACDGLNYGNNFQVYPVIGEYLKRHSPPTATVAVLGSEPELLFYAHRRPATGYIYMYDLVQDQPFRERMEKDMISEVEQARADFLVVVNEWFSWVPNPPQRAKSIRDWLAGYTRNCYKPVGLVTFPPSVYVWGPDCLKHIPPHRQFVVIFQRKHPVSAAPKL